MFSLRGSIHQLSIHINIVCSFQESIWTPSKRTRRLKTRNPGGFYWLVLVLIGDWCSGEEKERKGIWCPVIDFIRSRLWIAVHVYIDVLHWLLLAVGLGLSCGINKKAPKTDGSLIFICTNRPIEELYWRIIIDMIEVFRCVKRMW